MKFKPSIIFCYHRYSNSLQRWAENPDLLRNQEEVEQEDKERAEEIEDVGALAKARRWDEFKDGKSLYLAYKIKELK